MSRSSHSGLHVLAVRILALACAWACLLGSGCLSDEERASSHLERATAYLDTGDSNSALIEVQAALRAQPGSPQANFLMAQVVARQGQLGSAIDFYRETLRLDPAHTNAGLQLASLLRAEDPEEALALLQPIAEREPDNPLLSIALSEIAVVRGDLRSAQSAIERALELDPENAAAHKKRGDIAVLQAASTQGAANHRAVNDGAVDRALESFDRALELGVEAPWKAELGRARALATSKHRAAETADAFRRAIRSATGEDGAVPGPLADQKRSTLEGLAFARRTRDQELQRWVLERRVRLDPGNIYAWEELARSQPRIQDRDEVFSRLLRERPADFEAHQAYARHLVQTRRLEAALSHFSEQAAAGIEPARMRAARMNLLLRIGRRAEAEQEMEALLSQYPEHPRTRLEVADRKLRQGRIEEAVAEMRRLRAEAPSKEGLEALADLEYRLGNLDAARQAIEEAIRLTSRYDVRAERLLANVALDQGDFLTARTTLEQMRTRTELRPEETLQLATSLYETGRPAQGKALLERALAHPKSPPEAAIAFAQREGGDPESREQVRSALQRAFARHFPDARLLALLTRLDREEGRNDIAYRRLDRVIEREPEESLAWVLRAGARFADGDVTGAESDLRSVLERDPRNRAALIALRDLALEKGAPELALDALAAAPGALGAFHHPAAEGVLYHAAGKPEEAIAAYERALLQGQSAEVDNNLAYLLIERSNRAERRGDEAARQRDLERALELAIRANEHEQRNAAMRDTLGMARLETGDTPRALLEFMVAVYLADPPSASYLVHRGLAQQAMGDTEAAIKSYERALAIEPGNSEADKALERLKSAAASAP